jgi:DNA-binding PadR family transcriptional regulator
LIPGTLDMLILQAVFRGRTHGYAIADWIHAVSEETLQVEEGALYPALHRLEPPRRAMLTLTSVGRPN